MKTLIALCLLISSCAFAQGPMPDGLINHADGTFASGNFGSYNYAGGQVGIHQAMQECVTTAKQQASLLIAKNYPLLAHLSPEIYISTPDDSDDLPVGAAEIYVSYGCKTSHPASYLVVALIPQSSATNCDVDYTWDVGSKNAVIMCEESR